MRKTLNGWKLKERKNSLESSAISSKVPQKWLFVDTENGHIYGYNENGWCKPHTAVLEAGELAIVRALKYRHPLLLNKIVHKKADPEHICSWCDHWVPGIECSIDVPSYKSCERKVGWSTLVKTKNVRQKVSRKKK